MEKMNYKKKIMDIGRFHLMPLPETEEEFYQIEKEDLYRMMLFAVKEKFLLSKNSKEFADSTLKEIQNEEKNSGSKSLKKTTQLYRGVSSTRIRSYSLLKPKKDVPFIGISSPKNKAVEIVIGATVTEVEEKVVFLNVTAHFPVDTKDNKYFTIRYTDFHNGQVFHPFYDDMDGNDIFYDNFPTKEEAEDITVNILAKNYETDEEMPRKIVKYLREKDFTMEGSPVKLLSPEEIEIIKSNMNRT